MVGHVNDKGITELGVGLISVGWMGKLHSRAFQAIPLVYPELNIRPRLVHAADTAADRAEYARRRAGLRQGQHRLPRRAGRPRGRRRVDLRTEPAAQGDRHRRGQGRQAVLDREAGRPRCRRYRCGRRGGPRSRRRHLDRLQLPARARGGTHSRPDRERRAGPDHQRPRGVLQRVRLRAQRGAVLAVQEGPRRQRRARRPAQPRRRPDAVRGRADHRGQRTAVHHPHTSAPSCRWVRPRISR